MKLKVLVTGRNKRICRDICEHLEDDRGYIAIKCAPMAKSIFDIVLTEMPQLFILCLGNEIRESIEAYDVLKEAVKQSSATVIVITNDEDRKMFLKYSKLSKMYFLNRPVSLFALYEKLQSIEEELGGLDDLSYFDEFVNPNADLDYVRKRILVVDDDTEQLMNIKDQLKEFYDVAVVKSGEQAFKYLNKKSVDLMLLDYLMPEMDGPTVYRNIREDYEAEELPIIFLTGVQEKDKVINALLELKPQGYLVKPSKKSEIVAKIIEVLG